MPISDLEKKWTGMNFDIAAEEMRRLKKDPTDEEKLILYGLYKQSIHGNIPPQDIYGQHTQSAREEYVRFAEKMIQKYHRHVHRCKWNSEVWSVDY
ncbi:acyl CoA binding protein [Teladorsagia circumcincta]|uniref:Acyl CoA binding protein n=1 Tax=Teladorsagia circumcincta TaxID=45464 RepID=A0A2G9TPP6_TELCI|nr:acyl CoA binding protein [Teladorsagia circumcincta]